MNTISFPRNTILLVVLFVLSLSSQTALGFLPKMRKFLGSSALESSATSFVVEPSERNAKYGKSNMAQYLIDLHDSKATFDFCGGMMFQLVLSKALKEHLTKVAASDDQSVQVQDAKQFRMHQMKGYSESAFADNISLFHGREIRRVPWANGGMGFVLQLSLASSPENGNTQDPEGWTKGEVDYYDGWGHDVGRDWRQGARLENEGFADFRKQFGPQSFALHHRFYLHWDAFDRLWLSAEDGCEGTPFDKTSGGVSNPIQSFLQGLMK